MTRRAPKCLAAFAMAAALLAGCGSTDPWTEPRTGPVAVGTPGAGFFPSDTPSPESVVSASPGSWDSIAPTPGYRVALLTDGDSAPTRALADAVTAWAKAHRADVKTVRAADHADHASAVARAVDLTPELVISAGPDLVDALALVTASHLDVQFLLLGSELPEPTRNVTAVDWPGATFRGEGFDSASTFDPDSFTPHRCGEAVEVGVAAVLGGHTGYVFRIA